MPKNFKDQPGRHWPFHGCCRRFKMGLYNRPKNQQEQEMASTIQNSVKVQLYGQKEKLQIPWHEKLTGETVCKKAAAKCNIQCLSSTLFAICHRDTKMWLSPKERIEKDSELIFRFRFHVVTDAHALNSYEEQVLNYLYEQFHDDFIHGHIEDLSTEDRLGLIVISILQHNKGSEPLQMITSDSHFKSFVPKEWFRCLNTIDKRRLKAKVKGSLKKFREESGDGSTCYRLMFLASLIDNKPMLIVEQYNVMQGERSCIVRISANKGIEIECQQNLAIKWRLSDLTDINIYKRPGDQDVWTVQLNRRNGCPEFLQLKTRQEAEGLVTLLDGYYRLLIDYYHFLCKELAPPSLDLLTKNRCHGPIPRTEAFDKLRKAGLDDGTYLIRQNPEKYDSYCLSVVYGQEFKNYKIKIEEGEEKVSLNGQDSFESLRMLMEFYRNQDNCWCLDGPLKKCITSTSSSGTTTDNSLLITSRTGCPAPPSSPIPTRTNVNYIRESELTDPAKWRALGNGQFIEVKLGEMNQFGIPVRRVNVVIKMPKEGAPSDFNMMFSQLADKLSGLKHVHIIRFEGISSNYRSIFEYADKGPLDKYLASYKQHLKKPHLLQAATQIADALEFLEKKQIIHGSIAAHNVLVKHPPPRFHVKITDLMIGHYYFKLKVDHPIRMKRVRWTAPELLREKNEPTMASDKFSYGVCLWQIIAYGQKPYADFSDEQVRNFYLTGRVPEVVDCPEELKEIVNRCLMFQPYNRPSFRDVLRDVRQVMLKVVGDYAGDKENNDVFVYDELFPAAFPENTDSQPNQNFNGELVPAQSPHNNNPFAVPPLNDSAQDPDWDPEPDIMMEIDQEFHLRDIPNDNLQMKAKLGEGFYGEVHKAIWKVEGGFALNTEEVVAVKMLKEKHYEKYYEAFKKEIQWMGSLDHRNIVKVLGVCKGRYIRLVLEYVPLGALKTYLKDKRNIVSTDTLYLFCTQICDAMHYLGNQEGMCIVHRDLAARNILVASEDHVKITDFGLAKSFGSDRDYYVVKGSVDMPYKWYAPECICHLKFSREGDVWSFGVLMWEMFTYGMAPTYLDNYGKEVPSGRIVEFLEGGGRLQQRNTPDKAYEIMGRCWQTERTERPSFEELGRTCQNLMSGDRPL